MITPDIFKIRASLNAQKERGVLTDGSAAQTIFLFIDRENGIEGRTFTEFTYSQQVQRRKVYAEIRPQLNEYFSSDPDERQLAKFKDQPESLESFGAFSKLRLFGETFGQTAADAVAPGSRAVAFVFRNLYWIAPTAAALYFAPTAIQLSTVNKK